MNDLQDFHSFPAPAKLNLFLHIVGQRPDGYHLLQTVFRLLDFHDTVHLRPRTDNLIKRVRDVAGVTEEQDICLRAAQLLQAHTGCRLGVELAVEKRIPMGGGLGGGSSDAATVLLALNRLWNLHLGRSELQQLGLRLGADVPVFVFGKNAWAEGVGEQLQSIQLEPASYVVLTPAVHVSTAQVFASEQLTRDTIPTTIAAFSRGLVVNVLEPVVCRQYPAVAACLKWLDQFSQARMSGSGASVFAAFSSRAEAELTFSQLPDLQSDLGPVSGFVANGLEQHPLYSFAD